MKGDNRHKHNLEELFWGRGVHAHAYSTRTALSRRHTHRVSGKLSNAVGDDDEHVHRYEGVTSFEDGHVHRFSGVTGPAIPLPDGGHTHEFAGETSFDHGHDHFYQGKTGKALP
ncbi:MAG TPA: YmaF family protein [Bacilli bacterium]|nr:YmaF family protein [Bacilli bacterium]